MLMPVCVSGFEGELIVCGLVGWCLFVCVAVNRFTHNFVRMALVLVSVSGYIAGLILAVYVGGFNVCVCKQGSLFV